MKSVGFRLSTTVRYVAQVCLAAALTTSMAGCTGCLKDPAQAKKEKEDEEKKKKKKKLEAKPDFELGKIEVLPSDRSTPIVFVKPGHWLMASQSVKANNFDFQADIRNTTEDIKEVLFEIPNTDFSVVTERPVPLPKGQEKFIDTLHFPPMRQSGWKERNLWFGRWLTAANGGRAVVPDRQPVKFMPTYQFTFLVMASQPDLYLYFKQLTSVYSPTNEYNALNQDNRFQYYQLAFADPTKRVPLPSTSLAMSTLAYVLWDSIDPKALTSEQELALIEWLHWGGQLIISGPDSLDLLRNSFLKDYLPATSVQSAELTADDFSELNDFWSVPDSKSQERRRISIPPGRPILGIKLAPHPDSIDVGHTGGLVLERTVGRGRIVVTAFPLAARELVAWGGSFDSFVHNCLLRRPRRTFTENEHLAVAEYVEHPTAIRDARFVSQVRYFSRDVGHLSAQALNSAIRDTNLAGFAEEDDRESTAPRRLGIPGPDSGSSSSLNIDIDESGNRFGGYISMPQSGVAGWNDRSGPSDKARESLHDAAGISIPSAAFVLRVLSVYLLVLVPVNFGVFWLLGKIEWAWVSAPLLALIGAVAVVRIAQLDIGFARSLTEVGTLEVHAGLPVGHLTRYTALYTSLSTSYDIQFDSRSSLALPFPTNTSSRRNAADRMDVITMRYDREMKLTGFQVPSNQTEFVHTEQMLPLDGELRLLGGDSSGWELHNKTMLALKDACILRRTTDGGLQHAWIGSLDPDSSPSLKFVSYEGPRPTQWNDSATLRSYSLENSTTFAQLDKDQNGRLSTPELRSGGFDAETIRKYDAGEMTSRSGEPEWSMDELMLAIRRSHWGTLNLGQLADLAVQRLHLLPGEIRLVAWTDQEMPGMMVRPVASQRLYRTLVIAHLARGRLPDVGRDVNCLQDVFEPKDNESEEMIEEPTTENRPQS